jgi:multisubunit Na+/H+ antiporter MnhG subunit
VKPVSVDILLALAVLTEVVCVVGILCSATVYDRIHFSGATTTVAPFLVLAAVAVEQGIFDPTWNAVFDAVVLFFLNSVLSHATARVARLREHRDVEP